MAISIIRRYQADFRDFSSEGFPLIPEGAQKIDFQYSDAVDTLMGESTSRMTVQKLSGLESRSTQEVRWSDLRQSSRNASPVR